MTKRIYTITIKASESIGEPLRKLVRASSKSQAVHFVASEEFSAAVATQDEFDRLVQGGAIVHEASPNPDKHD